MNIFKLTTLTIALLFTTAANADYMVKIPLEVSNGGHLPNGSISFKNNAVEPVEPVEPEQICYQLRPEILNYSVSIGLNIVISTGYWGNKCYFDLRGIKDFSTELQLNQMGNFIINLETIYPELVFGTTVYGFKDNFGRALISNGVVFSSHLWSIRNK